MQPLLGPEAYWTALEAADMGGESGPWTSRQMHLQRILSSAQIRHSTVGRHQLQLLRSQLGPDQSLAQQLHSWSSKAASIRTAMWISYYRIRPTMWCEKWRVEWNGWLSAPVYSAWRWKFLWDDWQRSRQRLFKFLSDFYRARVIVGSNRIMRKLEIGESSSPTLNPSRLSRICMLIIINQ